MSLKKFSQFANVDQCLAECETRARSNIAIRQTYAGLKYICIDEKEGNLANDKPNYINHYKIYNCKKNNTILYHIFLSNSKSIKAVGYKTFFSLTDGYHIKEVSSLLMGHSRII